MAKQWLGGGAVVCLALLTGACTGDVGSDEGGGHGGGSAASGGQTSGSGGSGQGGTNHSGGAGGSGGSEPFTCAQEPTASPALAAMMLFDPAEPHPGDTLTVIVRTTNGTAPANAPNLVMQAEGAAGGVVEQTTMKAGGGDTFYYFAIANVRPGDVCLLGLIDGSTPEISGKVTVTPRPPGPPLTQGVYKVVTNHQWTCAEQPTYGNEVHVQVLDENGQGVPGAVVDVRYADSTDPGSIYNDGGDIPDTVTMDGSGAFVGYDYWPISDNGLLVFKLSVAGYPSDVATELTTGWWETNDAGCNYCNTYGKNVWGHWSHTVIFQRDPSAVESCEVDTDHAGQSACALPGHLHHHPQQRACWPAG